jgi:hypothetical protein
VTATKYRAPLGLAPPGTDFQRRCPKASLIARNRNTRRACAQITALERDNASGTSRQRIGSGEQDKAARPLL